jgi:hypothetical protein
LTRLILRDNNLACKAGGEAIADMLKGNSVLTELDLSKNNGFQGCSPAEFAQALSPGISGNGAMTSLNLSSNALGELVLPAGWTKEGMSYDPIYKHSGGRERKEHPGKPEGIIAVANAIKDMGALSVLSLKKNALGTKEAGKVLGQMLKENSVLKELDLSDNRYYSGGYKTDPEFAEELAAGIKDNGAISTFTFSGDSNNSTPVTMETSMVEADFGGKYLGTSGAIMAAAFLPKCT